MTSWIDGSFIYSTQEVWVSTMRSFKGDGSLKWGSRWGMPPHNTDRVPLFNHQSPHFMRMTDLDKMFCKCTAIPFTYTKPTTQT